MVDSIYEGVNQIIYGMYEGSLVFLQENKWWYRNSKEFVKDLDSEEQEYINNMYPF